MATRGEMAITIMMLMEDIELVYNDWGHPERAKFKKYWHVYEVKKDKRSSFAYTREEAALRWCHANGIHVDQDLTLKVLNESFGDDDGG